MKEASCHNDKMVAYYDEVWMLEERSNGLELHHIVRRNNLAADFLAKLASNAELVSPRVFVNDVRKLLVWTTQQSDLAPEAMTHDQSSLTCMGRDPEAANPLDQVMVD